MAWALPSGVIDAAIDDTTPPEVIRVRELIRRALEAANRGTSYRGEDESGIVIELHFQDGQPHSIWRGKKADGVDDDDDWWSFLPLAQV